MHRKYTRNIDWTRTKKHTISYTRDELTVLRLEIENMVLAKKRARQTENLDLYEYEQKLIQLMARLAQDFYILAHQ